MQDYYFSWGPCSPSLHRSCSLHRGVHSDCKFQLPLVPIYDNRNNVSYPSKRLNSFSKALLGFASFRGTVGGKTGDYLPPRPRQRTTSSVTCPPDRVLLLSP